MKSIAVEYHNDDSVDFYAQEWFKTAEKSLKASTAGRYQRVYARYIKLVVGEIKCSELNHEQIEKITENCAKCSEKTMELILSVLKLITDYVRAAAAQCR